MSRQERLSRFIQANGRTLIVPLDHGTVIPVPDMPDPAAMIEALNPWADGYVLNLGTALACREAVADKAVCLRTDFYKPSDEGHPDFGAARLFGPDEAELAGASAMMQMLYPHHPNEAEISRECADLIAESLEAEMPVIVEALPTGLGKPENYTADKVGFAVRTAAELGADIVKTAFPTGGDTAAFKDIVDACFVPVIVLGGAAMGDDEALLTMVRHSLDAGAIGIAVGRNVWQHPDPPAIAKALHALIHDDADVPAALKALG